LVAAHRMHREDVGSADVHGGVRRYHVKLNGYHAQMFDGTSAPDSAICDGGKRLAVPLLVSFIERVLQHCWYRMIVFANHKDKAVKAADCFLPTNGFRVFAWH